MLAVMVAVMATTAQGCDDWECDPESFQPRCDGNTRVFCDANFEQEVSGIAELPCNEKFCKVYDDGSDVFCAIADERLECTEGLTGGICVDNTWYYCRGGWPSLEERCEQSCDPSQACDKE